MNFLKENKSLIIGVVGVIVLFGMYFKFFRNTTPTTALVSDSSIADSGASELVSLLLELRSLKLDPAIFSSQAFQALKDFSVELVPEPTGRRNPFAPIGASEDFSETTTSDSDNLDALLNELDNL
jgi:hypothetical protein